MKINLLVVGLLSVFFGQAFVVAATKPTASSTSVATAAVTKPSTPVATVAASAPAPTETQKKVIADAQAAYAAASKKFVDATASITSILGDPAKTTAATNDGSLAKLVELSKLDEKAVSDSLQVLNAAKAAAGVK
jgi:cytoskeletal protein RodZ